MFGFSRVMTLTTVVEPKINSISYDPLRKDFTGGRSPIIVLLSRKRYHYRVLPRLLLKNATFTCRVAYSPGFAKEILHQMTWDSRGDAMVSTCGPHHIFVCLVWHLVLHTSNWFRYDATSKNFSWGHPFGHCSHWNVIAIEFFHAFS